MGFGIETKQSIAVVTASPKVNLSYINEIEFLIRFSKRQNFPNHLVVGHNCVPN